LVQSLWRIASAKGLAIDVRILPGMGAEGRDRRTLGEALREVIRETLR
jgi:1-acyl-sn-glycerol-3-phosphate acyltransferase